MGRRTFTLCHRDLVLPGMSLTLFQVLQRGDVAFKPDTFTFADPDYWVVEEFTIQHRSQLKPGYYPRAARDFAAWIIEGGCEVMRAQAICEMRVVYQGSDTPKRFRCDISGDWTSAMKLETHEGILANPATIESLAPAVAGLTAVGDAAETYLQAAGTVAEDFLVERRDGCAGEHYRGDRRCTATELVTMLEGYLRGSADWSHGLTWLQVEVGGNAV